MYELIQTGSKTYVVNCPSRIGIYQLNATDVCLIDSGSGKDAARKTLNILNNQNWRLAAILNTHSHADHIGGNAYLQQKTGCDIYAPELEIAIVEQPILEPTLLFAGNPLKSMQNPLLMGPPSNPKPLADMPYTGLSCISLPGHSLNMMGFAADDGVVFLGDALADAAVIEKYHIAYYHDIGSCLKTIDMLETLPGNRFVLSHSEPAANLLPLIELNRRKMCEIMALVSRICAKPTAFDDILKQVFDAYDLQMNMAQYLVVGNTTRSYLSYLSDMGQMEPLCLENKMLWVSK